MRKLSLFIFAGLAGIALLAILWGTPDSPAPGSLKVTFVGYTNGPHPVFQLANTSSHPLRLAPHAWLVSQDGQPFGSFPLPSSLTNGLSPHMSCILTMPTPLSGKPWCARFDVEPSGWQRQRHLARMMLRRLGLPFRNIGRPFLGGCSEMIEP